MSSGIILKMKILLGISGGALWFPRRKPLLVVEARDGSPNG
jgi:hypothetical protein